jgi:hypothetical protein
LLEQKTNDSSAPKSVLQDIESNLPEMWGALNGWPFSKTVFTRK